MTNCDRVDFEYIVDDETLHLTVRYRKYQVRCNSDGKLIDCPSPYSARLINRETVYQQVARRGSDDGIDEADAEEKVDDNAIAQSDSALILADAEFLIGDDLLYRFIEHRAIEGVVTCHC
jgi:hypothetical protein